MRQHVNSQDQTSPFHGFSTPPPGFTPQQNPQIQNVGGQNEAAAFLQIQMLQSEQTKQMMLFMQQQNLREIRNI